MTNFQLVIFDCDGVLVDSERITNVVFAEMLLELGLSFSLEDMFERFVGRSMSQCMQIIAELLGSQPPENFVSSYQLRTKKALQQHLTAVPGIANALDRIALQYCVASSGDHEKMRTTLGLTGLLPRFEGRLYSVTEVKNPKPAPDVFLHAAYSCGTEPSRCAVVEDSPTGVAAAVSAGMTVFGYCALTPPGRLLDAGAHRVFSNMKELPGLLGTRFG
jgi:HAD superfamily hydrolase (TIGR01509 family)